MNGSSHPKHENPENNVLARILAHLGASAPINSSMNFYSAKIFNKFFKIPGIAGNIFQNIYGKNFQKIEPNLPHPLKIYTYIKITKYTSIQEMLLIDRKIPQQEAPGCPAAGSR